jgi:hypothetical protein
MKKILFILLFLLSKTQSSFAAYDEYFEGLWQNLANQNFEEIEQRISGKLISDIDLNHYYDATDKKDEYNDANLISRFNSKIKINKNIFVNSNFLLTRMESAKEDDKRNASQNAGDRSFENLGIVTRELAISYSDKKKALIAGKFNPNFGTAWRWGRGIWARDLAQNYRQLEKLGIGAIYKLGDKEKTGRYNFGFSAFTNDRKNLDNSLINDRDSDGKDDQKAGNKKSLQSYIASLDVNFDFKNGEELSYHFAYQNLAFNKNVNNISGAKINNQKGFVFGSNYRYPINNKIILDGLLEYTDLKNLDGNPNISEKYFNANIVAEIYHNWNITLANSNRKNIKAHENSFNQNLSEISFGYKFNKNRFFDQLLFQAGYKKLRNDYKTSFDEINSLGILVRYIKSF